MKDEYLVFNAHRIGASHISKGLECEDYSLSYIDDNVAIAVISDGHGDKNCFRSARGAQLACETAIQLTRNICSSEEGVKAVIDSPDRIICELEKSIIFNWNRSVLKDIESNPISDAELSNLDDNVVEAIKSGKRLQKVYGCTLILNVFLRGFWFGIHVGDGKCVCVYENGLYAQPIPWDEEGCVGNRSTSLCDSKAFQKFRYVYGYDVPVAVFVGSDGVDESFDDNGINKCYFSLASWVKSLSAEELKARADELLEKISHGGSGDDVSIACIVSKAKEIKKPISTSKQVAEKMEELYTMLTGAEDRCNELVAMSKDLTANIERYNKEIAELEASLNEKKEALESKKVELESVERNLASMQSQLAPMIKQFEDAKGIKKQVDEYWSRLGVEPYDNSTVMNYVPSETMRIKESEPAENAEPADSDSSKEPVTEEPIQEPEITEEVPASSIGENENATEEIVAQALEITEKSIEESAQPETQVQNKEGSENGGFLKNLFKRK